MNSLKRSELSYAINILSALVKKEFIVKSRHTLFGISIVIIQPIVFMIAFTFLSAKYMNMNEVNGIHYPVYIYSGMLFWSYFQKAIQKSVQSIETNVSVIKKVYFPRESIVLSAIISPTVDLLISFVIFECLYLSFGYSIGISWLVLFPVLIIQMVYIYGIALILAPLQIIFRDIIQIVSMILYFMVFFTPIIIPLESYPVSLRGIIYYGNPMSIFIHIYRNVLLFNQMPLIKDVIYLIIMVLIIVIAGQLIFKFLMKRINDIL